MFKKIIFILSNIFFISCAGFHIPPGHHKKTLFHFYAGHYLAFDNLLSIIIKILIIVILIFVIKRLYDKNARK